jgi:hypothetical protein
MDASRIKGKELDILRFMKQNGFPVFHMSNIFLRDIQYGIRDFYRATERIDIGSRESDACAHAMITHLESNGMLVPFRPNTWILHIEEFLNPPKVEEKKEAAAA